MHIGGVHRSSIMLRNSSPSILPWWGWYALAAVLFVGACKQPEQYKVEADKEVYGIIDGKWDGAYGQQANYAISSVSPSPNDVRPDVSQLPHRLNLAQAVALATAQNRNYQRQKEQLYLSALDLTLARHDFARQWFGTIDGGYTHSPADESVDASGGIGFNQLLASGAMVSANLAIDWMRFLTGDPRTTLGSMLSGTITQPLLRGSSKDVVLENLTQSERNALYQIRTFNRYRKTFVVDIVTQYYGVLQSLDRVANAQSSYESLLANQMRVEMMADTGRVPRFQESEVRQSVLQAEDNYNTSMESYRAALDRFKLQLALPTDADVELDPNELSALELLGVAEPNVSLEESVQAALGLRLDLANAFDSVDDAARKVVVAADNLKAGLDLTASAGVPSSPGYQLDRNNFGNGTYSLGLSSDLPLDRKRQRNSYRSALITYEAEQRSYQEEVDQVKLDVRQAHRDVTEAYTSYQIQLVSLELARKRVDMQMILLQEGRATTRNYLDAQDDLLIAQNAKTSALVQFTLAKLRFYRDVGLLQVRPDGLWEQSEPEAGAETAIHLDLPAIPTAPQQSNIHARRLIEK